MNYGPYGGCGEDYKPYYIKEVGPRLQNPKEGGARLRRAASILLTLLRVGPRLWNPKEGGTVDLS